LGGVVLGWVDVAGLTTNRRRGPPIAVVTWTVGRLLEAIVDLHEVWGHYAEIMTDPAHLLAEVSLMVLVDVLFLGSVWPLVKSRVDRRVNRRVVSEHEVIDAEHGVWHEPGGPELVAASLESERGLLGWVSRDSLA
jgi:hypothetical protein